MKTLLAVLLLFAPLMLAQEAADQKEKAAGKKSLDDAQSAGIKLSAEINVRDNVNVEAVLLPRTIASMVFGKNIADNYAVIEVNVSNRNKDAALLIQSVYIDYCEWALSGLSGKCNSHERTLQTWETGTDSTKVASVESRIARGQLLQAQTWTTRNTVIKAMKLAGSIAAGFAFPFTADVTRGINAWNGTVVPGADAFWPDATVAQLNRISDFGFQNNKVIPQQAADIVVAFFPIDRFLTPGFKKIFLASPALFFNPGAVALDPEARKDKDLERVFEQAYGSREKVDIAFGDLRREMAAGQCEDGHCKLLDFLNKLSLNKVRLVVTGVMTLDLVSVPSKIDSIACDPDVNNPDIWAVPGTKTCTIKGSYLTGGVPVFTDSVQLGISDVSADKDGSTDKSLKFTFKLSKVVAPGTTLKLHVTKTGKNDQVTDSMEFGEAISYMLTAPAVTDVAAPQDGKAKATGTGFYDTPGADFKASARLSAKKDATGDQALKLSNRTGQTFEFSGESVTPACYVVVAQTGNFSSAVSSKQVSLPAPRIGSVVVKGDKKTADINGTQLDKDQCTSATPTVSFGDDQTPQTWKADAAPSTTTASKLTVTVPAPDTNTKAKWIKVRVKIGDSLTTADIKQ
jgi:hypothetical protein